MLEQPKPKFNEAENQATTSPEEEKASADMEQLTAIEKKNKQSENLTLEEIKFLYEIDNNIIGFGDEKDPRIEEIQKTRNIKEDLASVFNCREDQISLTKEEALSGDIVCHYGDLGLRGSTLPEGLTLPKIIRGHLGLRGSTLPEGLTLPETILGDLYLNELNTPKGLTLSETIRGSLFMDDLFSPEGLTLSKTMTIGGDLHLSRLNSTEGPLLPETMTIEGSLYLDGLTSAKRLTTLPKIGKNLYLNSLFFSSELITLPEVDGFVKLQSLTPSQRNKLREKYPNLYIVPRDGLYILEKFHLK